MQGPRNQAAAPIGVVYNTPMTRPDAALALAAMYLMEIKRESHMGSVCIVGAGFNAAVFSPTSSARCTRSATRNGNSALAVRLALESGVPDSAMVKTAVEHNYPRTLKRVADTSERHGSAAQRRHLQRRLRRDSERSGHVPGEVPRSAWHEGPL